MKKHISPASESHSGHEQENVPDSVPTSAGSNEGPHGVHDHKRFPNAEEVKSFIGDEVAEGIDAELAIIAFERHLIRIGRSHANQGISTAFQQRSDGSTIHSPTEREPTPGFIVERILTAIRGRRVDHRTLDGNARDRFNRALQQAHQAGTYLPLAAIHTDMTAHRMHTMRGVGPVGTQRFLPWHRQYLLQCENLLRTYEPSVHIPYWDYANDQARPDWVWQPTNVNRGTPGGVSLPTQQTVDRIIQNIPYTAFTLALEVEAHNDVHNWCNGTITSPPTAAYDPIFWLLHANVDRIWHTWQITHNGVPSLKAMDWILDPFAIPATDVDSIIDLGYSYR